MSAPIPQLPVVILPAEGTEAEVVRALERAGARIVSELSEAALAFVDFTVPGGEQALADLRRRKGKESIATIAYLADAEPDRVEALDLEFVTPAGLELELPARIRKAQGRHRARVEARQREKELSGLLRLTADYAASLDVPALLHDVTRRLAEEMDIDRAALVALDEQHDVGIIIAASDDAGLKDLRIELRRYPEIREVVRTGKPVIVEDAPSHPLLEIVKEQVAEKGIHAIAAMPLSVSGKVLGVLLLRTSDRRRSFSVREIDFLRTVAHATAVALRNARLLETERGLAEREKSARIHAEKLAEELRNTRDFLERLIDSSVDAIISADLTGKIIVFNKGAEAICGWTAEEAKSQINVRDLYPDQNAREIMKKLREDPRGQLALTRQDIRTKRGGRVPVNMTAAIVYEGHRAVATVGIFSDLRDRVELEQKLSSAEERLEESERNAVIVALAGTAAHELNQPLTSVMGYAELLKRRLKEGDFAWKPVDIIYREAERMAEIVRKIGKITRYETKSYVGAARILDLDKASSNED
ncbi:MAG: GAF domain-containing protein [Myxococcaceae bacterium]